MASNREDASTGGAPVADPPIIDAHHHFWELGHGRYPWLEHHTIPFRYGDYAAIRRSYLVDDFRRDHGSHAIVKSVHMEAEWDSRDPVAETRWLHALHDATGWPHAVVGQAWPDTACWPGTACTTICRRRGGTSARRRTWRATSPTP